MFRLPYTQDQCGSFLTAQRLISQKDIVDLDDTDRDEDEDKLEEDVFLVPDIDDDNEDINGRPHYIPPAPEYSYLDPTMTRDNDNDDDDITPDQQQEAWFELQNVSTYFIILSHFLVLCIFKDDTDICHCFCACNLCKILFVFGRIISISHPRQSMYHYLDLLVLHVEY